MAFRASVEPGRPSMRSCTSNTNALASVRTCWNRRSARRAWYNGGDRAADDADEDEDGRDRRGAMAPQQLPRRIERRIGTRENRPAFEIAAEIVAQSGRRGVAPLGLFPDRRRHDRVEIAAQTTRSPRSPRASARSLGLPGSCSQMDRSSVSGEEASAICARSPASSSKRISPSEYTSVRVVTGRPRTCSGLV